MSGFPKGERRKVKGKQKKVWNADPFMSLGSQRKRGLQK
jgi:hypothetical protein